MIIILHADDMKFARCATGKTRIIGVKNDYHGLSYGSLSMTGIPAFQEGFGPLLPGVEHIDLNDLESLERKLKEGDVAAFLAEPIQGKTVTVPHDDFLPQAQALCHKYGALFVLDEVKTGLGRTGKMFAFEHWNLKPDIITLAKTLSGGYVPAAAIVTRRDIYQKVFSRLDRCVVHSTTFGRNNLAMACGLATIQVIEDEKLVENCAKRGEQLVARLKEVQAKHEFIKEIRGKGLMLAIEFKEPESFGLKMAWKGLHAVDKGLFPQMIVTPLMQKHQILTLVAGHNIDAISFLPPLIIGDAEIDQFTNALDDVLKDLGKFPGPVWDFGMNLVKKAAAGKIKVG